MSEELIVPQTAPAPPASGSALTSAQFRKLAEIPPEIEWFANIDSRQTRRAYQNDLRGFMAFAGIVHPEDFRIVTRSHVLAWRKSLEEEQLGGATIRRKLAALSSLFEYLCESNAVTHNPVKGVKRPPVESWQGKTPALGDVQARALLEAPDAKTLKGKRDRAILSALLYHGIDDTDDALTRGHYTIHVETRLGPKRRRPDDAAGPAIRQRIDSLSQYLWTSA